MKKKKPEEVDATQILAHKSYGYGWTVKRNASGKPIEILMRTGNCISKLFDTKKYTIYALIRIERILEGTDGDRRTRQKLSRAKVRLSQHDYLS
jgi:hypothetical protein